MRGLPLTTLLLVSSHAASAAVAGAEESRIEQEGERQTPNIQLPERKRSRLLQHRQKGIESDVNGGIDSSNNTRNLAKKKRTKTTTRTGRTRTASGGGNSTEKKKKRKKEPRQEVLPEVDMPTKPPSTSGTDTNFPTATTGWADTNFPTNTNSSSDVWNAACEFCPMGLTVDATFVLPTGDGATCGEAMDFAATLLESDSNCPTIQFAQDYCCPSDDGVVAPTEPSTTTEVPAVPFSQVATTTEAPPPDVPVPFQDEPESDFCTCSPLTYNIRLSLSQLCDTDTIESNDGIGLTLCILYTVDENNNERTMIRVSKDELDSLEIFDVQFLEFGTQMDLTVIHQEDREVSLYNGDVISFDSISNELDPSMTLEEQVDYVPGGVQVNLRGRIETSKGSSEVVSQRLTWSYTNQCFGDMLPVEDGDRLGWITFVSSSIIAVLLFFIYHRCVVCSTLFLHLLFI